MAEYPGPKPMSPAEVESELMRLLQIMEEETDALGINAREHAEAETSYKVAYARAALSAWEKTQAAKELQATDQTADQRLTWKIAESRLEVSRERLKTLRAGVDALRTIAANLRTQT